MTKIIKNIIFVKFFLREFYLIQIILFDPISLYESYML